VQQLLWISLGGALGTGSRYLIGLWAERTWGAGFPFATLIVNVVGSFLLAAVTYLGLEAQAIAQPLRLFLTVGVMGGLTTYSSFNFETLRLVQSGQWSMAVTNVVVTLVGCGAVGVLGLFAGARIADALR
jgi:fluoride exporter